MDTDKKGISDLVQICAKKGLKTVVISPGSRNAPLIVSFTQNPAIECLSIIDERSAAFFALGIAQQTQQPVGLICTSGTASLNYAPALAEAYYQKIPLVVFTADRPVEWVDQFDGQTVRQKGIFDNYIKKSFQLPQEAKTNRELWHNSRLVSEAINTSLYPEAGPVHVNIPLEENLYGRTEEVSDPVKLIDTIATTTALSEAALNDLSSIWNSSNKKMIVTGLLAKNERLNELINKFAIDPSVTILTETTSNLNGEQLNGNIDNVLFTISEEEEKSFAPDLLITIGGPVVSKKIKAFLRTHRATHHWHIDPSDLHMDTYQSLTHNIPLLPVDFFAQTVSWTNENGNSDYASLWKNRDNKTAAKNQEYLATAPWSDLKVFEKLLQSIPENSNLHLGNSTPVRYAQLFRQQKNIRTNGNRGTSGIDGCTSTAAGAAFAQPEIPTTIITGDIGFFYDSNALWNKHLSGNLRIVIINNSGGGIFRFIDGPASSGVLEEFFETKHQTKAEHLAKAYDIPYYHCSNEEGLNEQLAAFYAPHNNRPVILEVETPNEINATVLKNYFNHLKS